MFLFGCLFVKSSQLVIISYFTLPTCKTQSLDALFNFLNWAVSELLLQPFTSYCYWSGLVLATLQSTYILTILCIGCSQVRLLSCDLEFLQILNLKQNLHFPNTQRDWQKQVAFYLMPLFKNNCKMRWFDKSKLPLTETSSASIKLVIHTSEMAWVQDVKINCWYLIGSIIVLVVWDEHRKSDDPFLSMQKYICACNYWSWLNLCWVLTENVENFFSVRCSFSACLLLP